MISSTRSMETYISLESVSYTHLDVYKRQGQNTGVGSQSGPGGSGSSGNAGGSGTNSLDGGAGSGNSGTIGSQSGPGGDTDEMCIRDRHWPAPVRISGPVFRSFPLVGVSVPCPCLI